ncbi:hypothetical protein OOU_Y34scaffold00702g5 [Pyricularia oryzae Y34]|uniref:Uncharacterized protein n=2 Tax=Pyricularia oryzae TaxID=318829 RepID=A0AA97NSI7_PYRO3|nr:hypothetical protein OOU_Y34scaffold00702g5 [Pyricularia oryzae Y34]
MKVLQLLFVTLLTNAFMVAANNGGDDDCAAAEEKCIRDCQAQGVKGIPDVVGRRGPLVGQSSQSRGLLFDSPAQCGELVFDSTVISMRYKSAGKQQIKRAVEESAHPKPPFVCNQRNREASRAVWVTLSNDGQLIARLAGTNASASVATTTDIAALWRDVKVQRGRDLGHGLGLNKGILIINQR